MTTTQHPLDIPAAYAPAPVPKTIEWEQGGQTHSATVHIRPLSWQALMGAALAEGKAQEDLIARRLADSVCDAQGKPLYSLADIQGESGKALCADLVMSLLNAMNEVNTAGKS